MKVKVGELKTHLSTYLRNLETQNEPLEVCLRDKTIAYLVAAGPVGRSSADTKEITSQLQEVGLQWNGQGGHNRSNFVPSPQLAGDGRSDIDTTKFLRESRDW